eukprot:1248474-Prymnesium_polylepis.1
MRWSRIRHAQGPSKYLPTMPNCARAQVSNRSCARSGAFFSQQLRKASNSVVHCCSEIIVDVDVDDGVGGWRNTSLGHDHELVWSELD